jgi:hypothetical protein
MTLQTLFHDTFPQLGIQHHWLEPTGWILYSPLLLQTLKDLNNPIFNRLNDSYPHPNDCFDHLKKLAFIFITPHNLSFVDAKILGPKFQKILQQHPHLHPNTPAPILDHILTGEIEAMTQGELNSTWSHYLPFQYFIHHWIETVKNHPTQLKDINTLPPTNLFVDWKLSILALFRQQFKAKLAQMRPTI